LSKCFEDVGSEEKTFGKLFWSFFEFVGGVSTTFLISSLISFFGNLLLFSTKCISSQFSLPNLLRFVRIDVVSKK